MPKPFPWPLNIGTDICSIPRILGILRKETASGFVRRILTSEERKHYQGRIDRPLGKWQEAVRNTVKLKEQIEWKQKQLGLSHAEVEYCIRLEKAGTKGLPSAWIAELRSKIRAETNGEVENHVATHEGRASGEDTESDRSPTNVGPLWSKPSIFVSMQNPGDEISEDGNTENSVAAMVNGKQKLDDIDIIIHLLMRNQEAVKVAECDLQKAAEFMAGRFAAKEAAMKAHHHRRLTYQNVSILPLSNIDPDQGSRPPIAVVVPEDGDRENGQEVKISISHDGDYATAVCMACEPGLIRNQLSKSLVTMEETTL